MANSLNGPGSSNAGSLVSSGKVDKTSDWSFSAEDGNELLGPDGDDWAEYGRWHLGKDTSADSKTKAYYKYPFGKGGKVYRSAIIAIKSRAGGQGDDEIGNRAATLLESIDGKSGDDKSDRGRRRFTNQADSSYVQRASQMHSDIVDLATGYLAANPDGDMADVAADHLDDAAGNVAVLDALNGDDGDDGDASNSIRQQALAWARKRKGASQ